MKFHSCVCVSVNGTRDQLVTWFKFGNLYGLVAKVSRVEWTHNRSQFLSFQVWSFVARKFVFVIKHSTTVQRTFGSQPNSLLCNNGHKSHTIVWVTQFANNFLSNTRNVSRTEKWFSSKLNFNKRSQQQRTSTIDDDVGSSSRTKLKTQRKVESFELRKCCAALARENRVEENEKSAIESFSVPSCASFVVYMANLLWNLMMLNFVARDELANIWLEVTFGCQRKRQREKRFVIATPSVLCNFSVSYNFSKIFSVQVES